MKVAMISYYHVSLEAGGGVGVQIRKTAEYLRKLGVDVEFFDCWKPLSMGDFDIYHFFPAHPFFEHFICRVLKPLGANIVVSPVFWPQYSIPLETVWTRMTGILPQIFSSRSLMRKILNAADLLLPNSEAEADVITRIFGVSGTRMKPVPNGTDMNFSVADPKPFKAKFPFNKFVLYVGNIGYERKNHERLVQAWTNIDADLILIGNLLSTSYSERVMREIVKNDRVHYLGFLPHEDPLLASAYSACDVFILPGSFETPGLAALEAGMAGAKVAVTCGGSTKEYFGDDAVYLNPYSRESIRQAVLTALSQDHSPKLRHRITERFSWEHVASLTLEGYEKVLKKQ